MALDWRETLRLLQKQFESRAANAPGLHHLFVEVADNERSKMSGPAWFTPYSSDSRFIEGRPHYSKWDCSTSTGLPLISPGFREANSSEDFLEDARGVIRDGSGVARAVATPMKLRQGYYCGQAADAVDAFNSLADSAAAALAGTDDLGSHAFATELTDIFRKPRGGVRYIFGEIGEAPKQFIASGWNAGVLQYKHGVLIDLPISESPPRADHWLILLHRLGWRRIPGSPLKAERAAWEGNTEVSLEMLDCDWSRYPAAFAANFSNISPSSYYSVLGTKEAPLDINLASAFAIQLLLSKLDANVSSAPESSESPDYSGEPWKTVSLPPIRAVKGNKVPKSFTPILGIVVATDTERHAVLKKLRPLPRRRFVLQVHTANNTCFIGRLGTANVVLCMTAMGSIGRDSAILATGELIDSWQLRAVIMAGIAFGKDATKQEIGKVLVSDSVVSYEPQRLGRDENQDRGERHTSGTVLLNRFRNIVGWDFRGPNGRPCGFQIGPLLSGEKLVDNPDSKRALFERFPAAIGGDMEGAGVAAVAERKRCEWIIIKGICDWGDGKKTGHHQEFAAAASVDLVEHVLNQPGALDALHVHSTA